VVAGLRCLSQSGDTSEAVGAAKFAFHLFNNASWKLFISRIATSSSHGTVGSDADSGCIDFETVEVHVKNLSLMMSVLFDVAPYFLSKDGHRTPSIAAYSLYDVLLLCFCSINQSIHSTTTTKVSTTDHSESPTSFILWWRDDIFDVLLHQLKRGMEWACNETTMTRNAVQYIVDWLTEMRKKWTNRPPREEEYEQNRMKTNTSTTCIDVHTLDTRPNHEFIFSHTAFGMNVQID
jgi:hypothetical protein